jgi:ubiquitin-like 1-activating enzyme E1 B
VVGAGGIGCELLKNLVLTGFTDLTVIDLDTIDVSNLNRQFLFRKHNVGQSKSEVATEAVLKMNPHCSIKHYCDNVMKPEFGVSFVKQFDVVMNALDNLAARKHMNRLCLAAEKPLIESGTTGYLGQVSVHLPHKTECFECTDKPTPKSYPICTIAATPNKPIHNVHWGKMVYEAFFGVLDLDNTIRYLAEGSDGFEGIDADFDPLKVSASPEGAPEPTLDRARVDWAQQVFMRCFHAETERLLGMEGTWTNEDGTVKRRKPVPTAFASALGLDETEELPLEAFAELDDLDDQAQMTLRQAVLMFLRSVAMLRGAADRPFDKDDPHACEFVIAACHLRGQCFHMEPLTPFKAKEMAGNIIAAIASTNAIIAAMIVLEGIKILQKRTDECKSTFLTRKLMGRRSNAHLSCQNPMAPNKKCFVCGTAIVFITLNTKEATLDFLVSKVLKGAQGFVVPNVSIGKIEILHGTEEEFDEDEGEGEYAKVVAKTLAEWTIVDGSTIMVDDDVSELKLTVTAFSPQPPPFAHRCACAEPRVMSLPCVHACACVQVQIVHAELDEEEVPEGFTVGLGNDASRTNPEEQASGGKKRAADEVLIASCSLSVPSVPSYR